MPNNDDDEVTPVFHRCIDPEQEFIDLLIEALDNKRDVMNGWQVQIDPKDEKYADEFTVSFSFSIEDEDAVAEVADAALGDRVGTNSGPAYD